MWMQGENVDAGSNCGCRLKMQGKMWMQGENVHAG